MTWNTEDGTEVKDEYKGSTLEWDPVEERWVEVHHFDRIVKPKAAAEFVEIPISIFPNAEEEE